MVVKRFAVILNGTDVENVIVLDDSLEATWFENVPDRTLVEDTGQANVQPGANYDELQPIRDRFTYAKPAPTRRQVLVDKLIADTITEREHVELSRLEHGGS